MIAGWHAGAGAVAVLARFKFISLVSAPVRRPPPAGAVAAAKKAKGT